MKKKKEKKKPLKNPAPVQAPPVNEEKDEKFDFGGIPDRDLKKNLGCG